MELRDKNGLTEKEFLAAYKEKNYPKPSLTADILVFSKTARNLKLLLIKRGGHPFLGKWALPGGFVNPDESADEAAKRELFEETHVRNVELSQLGLYSNPKRDPRTWVISEAYITCLKDSDISVRADDDASEAVWFDVVYEKQEATDHITLTSEKEKLIITIKDRAVVAWDGLAFDHGRIIYDGYMRLPNI